MYDGVDPVESAEDVYEYVRILSRTEKFSTGDVSDSDYFNEVLKVLVEGVDSLDEFSVDSDWMESLVYQGCYEEVRSLLRSGEEGYRPPTVNEDPFSPM